MDSLSVISISSDSVDRDDFVSITLVKSGNQKLTVDWNNTNVKKRINEISNIDKALGNNSWMKNLDDSKEIHDPENQRSTCIRYDFDKSPKTPTLPKSCFTRATPLFSYMEEAKKKECHKSNGCFIKCSENCVTPLSPESQKKELCNYLQLMKPEEKPKKKIVKYRRSERYKKLQKQQTEGGKYASLKSEMQLKMKKLFSFEQKNSDCELLPLPPETVYAEVVDFEESVKSLVKEHLHTVVNGGMEKVEKRKKLNFGLSFRKKLKRSFLPRRMNLRSRMRLRRLPLDKLILRNPKLKKKRRQLLQEITKKKLEESLQNSPKIENPRVEIISVPVNAEDENIDLKNFLYDMLELDNMSEEHRKSVIESRILASSSITNLINKRSPQQADVQRQLLQEITKKKLEESLQNSPKIENSRVEIVSVSVNSDDENIDLKNFVDDMLELDNMSEEHRKSVIESRILASSSITNLINKISPQEADVQKAYKIFSDLSNEKKTEEKENAHEKEISQEEPLEKTSVQIEVDLNENNNMKDQNEVATNLDMNQVMNVIVSEHDYATLNTNDNVDKEEEDEEEELEEQSDVESLSPVTMPDLEVLPVNSEIKTKSLHSSLTLTNKRRLFLNGLHNWNAGSNSNRKSNHSISISKKNGSILVACYQDYNLVIVQHNLISFWTQSALGNVLGAQNMWIPKGEIQRISLNSTYTRKNAMEMVITTETSVAFVELWTKEHKSELREVPLADVFATVYFWRLRQNGLEKKALQLENIQGFADDVQYCVLKGYPRIIVSWHALQGSDKKTKIHSFHLAADFQTVANISEIQPVQHYVSSLHNIEDCDSLVMGCGENKVTLWNVEYGYIVATIEMVNIELPLATLWVKCDRGFLFTIQECLNQELRLIAINGMDHSWKKLQSYHPISGYNSLKGVCIENGILVAYYPQGILCWNAQTGELIVEEGLNECEYIPSGKNVIMITNENVIVRHSLSHLITDL